MPLDGRLAAALGGLSALLPLSIDMYLPCFDAMASAFGVEGADIAFSLPTFFAGMFCGQLFWGPLSDRFGRRRPLLVGLAGFVFASLACSAASSLPQLAAMRALQAFCGAAGVTISRAMVRDCFVGTEAVRMIATLMLVQGIAPMVGPSVGGLVQVAFGWRGVFWLLALLAALLWATASAFVPETHHAREARLTPLGVVRRYLSILSDRSFLRYAACGSVVGSSLFVYLTCAPLVLIDLLGLSTAQFGFVFSGNAFCLWLVGQSNRLLLRRYAPDRLLQAGLLVTLTSGLFMLLGAWPVMRPALLLPSLLSFLCGLPLIWPNVSARALANQGHRAGSAAATQGASQWACAALASLLASRWHDGTALPMAALMTLASLGGALAYFTLSWDCLGRAQAEPFASPRTRLDT